MKINWKELLFKRPTCKNCNTYSWTITIMLAGILFMVWAYQHDTGYERLMECNDRYQELSKHVNLVNPPYKLLENSLEGEFILDLEIKDDFNDFYKEDEDPYNCLITHCRDENIWVIDITDASQVIRFKNEVFVESELE